jgi:hypothetical protein
MFDAVSAARSGSNDLCQLLATATDRSLSVEAQMAVDGWVDDRKLIQQKYTIPVGF